MYMYSFTNTAIHDCTDCMYGDKRDCSSVTLDRCNADANVRSSCCETCAYLQDNSTVFKHCLQIIFNTSTTLLIWLTALFEISKR